MYLCAFEHFNLWPSCLCSTGGRCTWWRCWPWSSPSSSLRSIRFTSANSGSSCARSSSARWPGTASSPPSTGSSSPEASPQSLYKWACSVFVAWVAQICWLLLPGLWSSRCLCSCLQTCSEVDAHILAYFLPSGFCSTSPGDVLHCYIGANLLRFKGSWTLLPRWHLLISSRNSVLNSHSLYLDKRTWASLTLLLALSCLYGITTGQLNYLGSSHQVWHVLLVLMFYWWHQSSGFIMAYRHSQPCPEAPQHA